MPERLFEALAELKQVEAIALGGSRAGEYFDEKSDYDVYVYVTAPVEEEYREKLLSEYCSYIETGNHFWEYEDNGVLKNGIDIDILYRNLDDFCRGIEDVVVRCQPSNAYTTCMWHNLLNCRILYDAVGRLTAAPGKIQGALSGEAEEGHCGKAASSSGFSDAGLPGADRKGSEARRFRKCQSLSNRISGVYFDLIFAVNEKTHPGEKRLVELCRSGCRLLPENFEENLENLFRHMYAPGEERLECLEDVKAIVKEVKKLCADI